MIPSAQVESTKVSVSVTGEVNSATAFWDVGFWDVGFWDVGFIFRTPVVQLVRQIFSINSKPTTISVSASAQPVIVNVI